MVYTLPNLSNYTTGMEGLVIAETSQIPQIAGAILFFIYVIILGVGYSQQEKRTGAGNLAMWSSIAGLITTTGGFILLLDDNLFSASLLGIVLISVLVTIVSAIWFLTSERD